MTPFDQRGQIFWIDPKGYFRIFSTKSVFKFSKQNRYQTTPFSSLIIISNIFLSWKITFGQFSQNTFSYQKPFSKNIIEAPIWRYEIGHEVGRKALILSYACFQLTNCGFQIKLLQTRLPWWKKMFEYKINDVTPIL